jgi:hypothetical protein
LYSNVKQIKIVEMTKTNLYMYDQNNSGGSFDVDGNLSHRVVIEAESRREASRIAEDLGIYFNGCEEGMDCPCCGDRWYDSPDDLSEMIEKYGVESKKYYGISEYSGTVEDMEKKYEGYDVRNIKFIKAGTKDKKGFSSSFDQVKGELRFRSVDEYLQFMADEYGWCDPDIIVHYKDGSKKTFTGRKR